MIQLIKTNSVGEIEWNTTLPSDDSCTPERLIQTKDGGYLLSGYSYVDNSSASNYRSTSGWLTKIDKNGSIQWTKNLGVDLGPELDFSFSNCIQTTDGSYILIGVVINSSLFDASNQHACAIVKLNEECNLLWIKFFGYGDSELLPSIVKETNDGYIIAGNIMSGISSSPEPAWSGWLAKTDLDGNFKWEKTFNAPNYSFNATNYFPTYNYGCAISDVIETGCDYVIAGRMENNSWLMRTDLNGNIIWNKTYNLNSSSSLNSVVQAIDGTYIAVGLEGNQALMLMADSFGNLLSYDLYGNVSDTSQLYGGMSSSARSITLLSDGSVVVAGTLNYDTSLVYQPGYAPTILPTILNDTGTPFNDPSITQESSNNNTIRTIISNDTQRVSISTNAPISVLTPYPPNDTWLAKFDLTEPESSNQPNLIIISAALVAAIVMAISMELLISRKNCKNKK